MSQEAVDLKNQGNKAFAAGDYPTAVELYSKAITANDKEPTFFTNRAQVRTPRVNERSCDSLLTLGICRHTSRPKRTDMPSPMPGKPLS